MLNQIVLVGKIVNEPIIEETGEGKKISTITLAVSRSFKNKEGVYDTDFIDVTLFEGIAKNVNEYCKKGDVVGIKGRVQSSITTDDGHTIDENKKMEIQLIAERVTFLSSRKSEVE